MCDVKKCKNGIDMVYYKKLICWSCWEKHCKGRIDLKVMLGIKTGEEVQHKKEYEVQKRLREMM